MWSCMIDEIEVVVEDKELYEFMYYFVFLRMYFEVELMLNQIERKNKRLKVMGELQYFYFEDEEMRKFVMVVGSFEYIKEGQVVVVDSKCVF